MDSERGGGASGGRGHGRRGGRRRNRQNQGGGRRGSNRDQPNQGGGVGEDAPHPGPHDQPPAQHTPPLQQPHQQDVFPASGTTDEWPSLTQPPPVPPLSPLQRPAQPSAVVWAGRKWGPSLTHHSPGQPLSPPQQSTGELGMQKHRTSEKDISLSSSSKSKGNQIQAIRRFDKGGAGLTMSINLLVNHFLVKFGPENSIFHHTVDVKPDDKVLAAKTLDAERESKELPAKTLRKAELRVIRDKLFSDHEDFKNIKSAYDGKTNIFTAVRLREKSYTVEISDNEYVKSGSYTVEIKSGKELKLSKLQDYISKKHSDIPRDILQGLDLVMKENPSKHRIVFGRGFYSPQGSEDLVRGVVTWRGFKQSLKPTLQGLALCLDYSVLAFLKPLKVIDFVREHINGQFINYVINNESLRRKVEMALKGLKVRVTHRATKQKYIIASLAGSASETSFDRNIPDTNSTEKITIEKYFNEQWNRNIEHPHIPCLELGKNGRSNIVPMEFCVLVEGQRFQPKEYLDDSTAQRLENFVKEASAPGPIKRKDEITGMVVAKDGPCGEVPRNFGIEVDTNMTKVKGRVIGAPELKVGGGLSMRVQNNTCQWNFSSNKLLNGKKLEAWVLLDFTAHDKNKPDVEEFIKKLIGRCSSLNIEMSRPLFQHPTKMDEFSSSDRLKNLLRYVVDESKRTREKLQMIVCVMTRRDPGYKYLKWVSETQIGVVTQCCLPPARNKRLDQYLANLCLKINAKLGGSNFELNRELPRFSAEEHVMFIGADVNHPGPNNKSCPSIAAVVGTVNWPAANHYAARLSPQENGKEDIVNFGAMCLDLINTYARLNKVKPTKIVVFRDGVSDGQFEIVLNQELADLKKAISEKHNYNPTITFVVAQKRHQTRLFVENGKEKENVPPGTVVDQVIVNPDKCNFYLCSHHGSKGTSKPTHYYVLSDENSFETNQLQQLIYHMCFTFARCTKPVSLVPPVYYADLLAYRGRMFQEAAMETQSAATAAPSSSAAAAAAAAAPSSSAATAAPSSTASFDPNIYTLHPDLENIMFFV